MLHLCLYCNMRFRSRNLDSKYCSTRCYRLDFRKGEESVCVHCGSAFYRAPSRLQQYCSRVCHDAARHNPIYHICAYCDIQYPVTGKKKAQVSHFCSARCKYAAKIRPYIEKICDQCGKTYRTPQRFADVARFCSYSCFHLFRGETSLERTIRIALDALSINYQQEYPINAYCIDFFLPDIAVALECDGTFWHEIPGVGDKDRRRDAELKKQGITTIRIRDSELIKHDPASIVLNKLLPFFRQMHLLL